MKYHRPVRLSGGDYPLPETITATGARVWHYASLPTTNLPDIGGLSCGMWTGLESLAIIDGSLCPFLVCPMDADVRGDDTVGNGQGDVIEFPGMSRTWWRVLSVVDRNKALPNEYRVAMITRIGPYTYPQR